MKFSEKISKTTERLNALFSDKIFILILALTASVVTVFDWQVGGTVFFVLLICLQLAVCEDITVTTPTLVIMCVFVCMCYDSFNTFIKLWWLALIALPCLIFHFVKYRKPLVFGPTFYGIVAVTVAVTLGGIGFISPEEYFKPIALYYTAGLGIGMLLCYVLIKSQMQGLDYNRVCERIMLMLYAVGYVTTICVVIQYVRNFDTFIITKQVLSTIISRNNFSTFLMFALPIPFYFALKNPIHLISSVIFYMSIILTGSRGGLIFGTVEFFMCLVFMVVYAKDKRARIVYLAVLIIATVTAILSFDLLIEFYKSRANGQFIDREGNDTRSLFLRRLPEIFRSNPIFGQGFGTDANLDIYTPKKGGLCWYHTMIPQIIGSLGIAGALGYGYQLVNRIRTAITRASSSAITLFISYIGVFMMSQVNPGELCPLPYELLIVIFFIIIENEKPENGIFYNLFKERKPSVPQINPRKTDGE